jgi:MFS family permease
MTATESTWRETADRPDVRKWLGLAALVTGMFVSQLDFFMLNVALPTIQRDLSASLAEIQLIAVAYGSTYAATVMAGGRLGDLFGRRRLFLWGMAGLGVASLLGGVAWSGWVIVAARVLQGCAAGALSPQITGTIHALFPERGRDRAFAILGTVTGAAWAGGIVVGGVVVELNIAGLGWRAIFLIKLPLIALALVGGYLFVKDSHPPRGSHLDLPGLMTLSVIVGLIIVPLIEGPNLDWPWWTFVALALAGCAIPLLARIERTALRSNRSPLLSPGLFADRTFRVGLLLNAVFFLGPPAFFLLTELYLQGTEGFSPYRASMFLLPFGIGVLLASYAMSWLKQRLGDQIILLGVAVMFIGLATLLLLVENSGRGSGLNVAHTVPSVALIGIGQGLVTTPLSELLLRNIAKEIASTASAVFRTVQLLSQGLSVVVLVIVFGVIADWQVSIALPAQTARLRQVELAAGASPSQAAQAADSMRSCVRRAAPELSSGASVSCAPAATPADSARLESAARQAAADAIRRSYVRTMLVNLAVILATGVIAVITMRRARRTLANI